MKEELNLKCPYKVYRDNTTFAYHFTTKHEIEYSLAFAEYSDLLQSILNNVSLKKVYAINLVKVSSEKEPLDFGVEKTIAAIIESFF